MSTLLILATIKLVFLLKSFFKEALFLLQKLKNNDIIIIEDKERR
nr:MAG TPA: hypothetical protein [Bacteriophage sp.]